MYFGYALILLAAFCWGSSAIIAKYLTNHSIADPLLICQTRVSFAWIILLAILASSKPKLLKLRPADLLGFALLGIIGMAGANFFLYFAISRMNPALADLLQFTAPVMVAVWLWGAGRESMDKPKAVALLLSLIGCGLALEAFHNMKGVPLIPAASALGSAVCFAFLVVFGKGLTARYPTWSFLHYSLMSASIFWLCVTPPARYITRLSDPKTTLILIGFSILSILVPYALFFTGLRRVPAGRAGIVSTFEPVVIAIGTWIFLGESLNPLQSAGILLVLVAIAIVEATGKRAAAKSD